MQGESDDVPAALPSFEEQLIKDSYGPRLGSAYNNQTADPLVPINKFAQDSAALARLYAVPPSLENSLTFSQTLRVGCKTGRLVLCVLLGEDFVSLRMNRDVWSGETLLDLINGSFLFWERSIQSPQATEFISLYKPVEFPYIAAIEPRTGRVCRVWSHKKFSDEATAMSELLDFLESKVATDFRAAFPEPRALPFLKNVPDGGDHASPSATAANSSGRRQVDSHLSKSRLPSFLSAFTAMPPTSSEGRRYGNSQLAASDGSHVELSSGHLPRSSDSGKLQSNVESNAAARKTDQGEFNDKVITANSGRRNNSNSVIQIDDDVEEMDFELEDELFFDDDYNECCIHPTDGESTDRLFLAAGAAATAAGYTPDDSKVVGEQRNSIEDLFQGNLNRRKSPRRDGENDSAHGRPVAKKSRSKDLGNKDNAALTVSSPPAVTSESEPEKAEAAPPPANYVDANAFLKNLHEIRLSRQRKGV